MEYNTTLKGLCVLSISDLKKMIQAIKDSNTFTDNGDASTGCFTVTMYLKRLSANGDKFITQVSDKC